MSDPMKSADIEDVLSSIRRLVADTPDGAQAPATAAGNRLVLTPALRVGEAQAQAHAEAAQSPAPSQQDAADTPAQAGADGAPHHSADDDAPTPDIEPVEDTTVLEWEDHDSAAAPVQDNAQDNTHDRAAHRVEMDANAAQDEALHADHDAPHDDATHDDAPEITAPAGHGPDGQSTGADADTADHNDQAPDTLDLMAEDGVIDEEMLRELVADIVRQELQGALGERITRNVRKLVRREIHRALSAAEFE